MNRINKWRKEVEIILKVILIIFFLAAIFTYLIILGANKFKTEKEKADETNEEMRCLKLIEMQKKAKNGKKNK